MWTSIKLQVAAYKWVIIIGIFAVLSIAVAVQYAQISTLTTKQSTLEDEKKKLEGQVTAISEDYNAYKNDVNSALANLQTLRDDLATISSQTAKLQSRVDALRKPPASGGSNYQDIQDEANLLTNDLFKRIENTSKGTK